MRLRRSRKRSSILGRSVLKHVLKFRTRKFCLIVLLHLIVVSVVAANYFLRTSVTDVCHSGTCPCTVPWNEDDASIPEERLNSSIWTIHPTGRLGNQMGEYAALYALAKLNGHSAYILPEMYDFLSPIFNISLPVLPERNHTQICWREFLLHDWMSDEYKFIRGKYVKLTGYPCSWTFYHHIRDEILREFTFHDDIKQEVNTYLEKVKGPRKTVTYVGVHVRRGDYVNVMPKTWKGVIADEDYLKEAMTYFREKYPHSVFVVASNGMDWCKENINNAKGDVYFLGDGNESSPANDFALLAHCNHTIITIGTFGYWAAYLAGGETVYLTNFTLPDSPFLEVFRYEAAFLPHWVGIPAKPSSLAKLYALLRKEPKW